MEVRSEQRRASPRRLLPLALLAFALQLAAPAGAKQLWLIGGGEPICSSIEPEMCVAGKRAEAEAYFARTQALRGKRFRYSAAGRLAIASFAAWVDGLPRRQSVLAGLDALRPRLAGKSFGEKDWHALLAPLELSEEELGLIDDIFQVRQTQAGGGTRKEQVYLDGSEPYVLAMFRDFVAAALAHRQAGHEPGKPRVVLLTTASTNPLADVDYYTSLFEQAGAEVRWLPLEPALLRAKDCDGLEALRLRWNGVYGRNGIYPEWARYQREFCRHPERMAQVVDSADAFFFNGGDQSLTLRSLQDDAGRFTPLAQRLLARVDAGVPLAGSSAGTAVESGNRDGTIPMISDGSTAQALRRGAFAVEVNAQLCRMNGNCTMHGDPDQLNYRADGGLRTFAPGVVDTHFRERDREGRLLRLLLDTGARYGFGVDEATLLKVDFTSDGVADMQVSGRGGVWIVDAGATTVAKDDRQWRALGFHAARLLAGDSAQWRQGAVTVSVSCRGDAAPAQLPDEGAYAAVDGRRWTHLPETAPVSACRRDDGRWRHGWLTLQLTQDLAPVDGATR